MLNFRTYFLAGTLFVLLCSCEKDPMIEMDMPQDLSAALKSTHLSVSSLPLWAAAGAHSSFERETDDRPIHVLCFPSQEHENWFVYRSDSVFAPDSLHWYRITAHAPELDPRGVAHRLSLKAEKKPYIIRLAEQCKDSLRISSSIYIRHDFTTQNHREVQIIGSATGRCDFRWRGAIFPEPEHLLMLEDRTGSVFCALVCNSRQFFFYDLRNVNRVFTPALRDPLLALGERYRLRVSSINELGWMTYHSTLWFTADTNSVIVKN